MGSWAKMLLVVMLNFTVALGAFGCASVSEGDEYVGTWTFESLTDGEGVQDEESTAFVNSLGVTEEITLNDDGTGILHLFGESRDFTWERNNDAQEVVITIEGEATPLQLVDGKLRLEGQKEDGGVGYFVFVKNIGDEGAEASEANAADAEVPETSAGAEDEDAEAAMGESDKSNSGQERTPSQE